MLSGSGGDVKEEHEVHAHLRDGQHRKTERTRPGAQSSDVLATQNDVTVRSTAKIKPVVLITKPDYVPCAPGSTRCLPAQHPNVSSVMVTPIR